VRLRGPQGTLSTVDRSGKELILLGKGCGR
jgi:NAD(P)H-flavin reductase